VATGALTAPRPGPLADIPAAQEQKPVRLELRPGAEAGTVGVELWTGGWLLCALPSLRFEVDGRSLGESFDSARSLDVSVEANEAEVKTTFVLPASLVRTVLLSATLTVHWDGGSGTVLPASSTEARSLAALLGQPTSSTGDGGGSESTAAADQHAPAD
jgi:hypothetical protein